MRIHPLAVIDPAAQIGQDVAIGPFCVVESGAIIGDGCVLESHVVVKQGTRLGRDNHLFEGAIIGGLPQHLRMPEQVGRVLIGNGNTIREHVTIHRGLDAHHDTLVGDQNFLMAGVHVAHDCIVGNQTIFANNATLGGHVLVEDRAYLSGHVAVHQFCRVGRLAMVGGLARVTRDVPPYMMIDGSSNFVVGLNRVGLRRADFSNDDILQIKKAYRVIYRSGLTWREVLQRLEQSEFAHGSTACYAGFLAASTRGIVQERRLPPGATIKLGEAPEAADESAESSAAPRAKAG